MNTYPLRKQILAGLALASLTILPLGVGAPVSYAPPAVSAQFNIRYSWGLGKEAREGIGKDRMSTTDRYDLPASRPIVKGAAAEQTIEGAVEGLPFMFYLRLTRSSDADPGLLEINVVDQKTGQPLSGFPEKLPRALTGLKGEDGVEVDLKLSKNENAIVLDWLRVYLKQSGEKVHGTVVADPPFLRIRATDGE